MTHSRNNYRDQKHRGEEEQRAEEQTPAPPLPSPLPPPGVLGRRTPPLLHGPGEGPAPITAVSPTQHRCLCCLMIGIDVFCRRTIKLPHAAAAAWPLVPAALTRGTRLCPF
ncbi:hypothetical protein E2C01_098888 [Portunus trituberculatus]|uniref:Uncharacterized protein n=1 Tax=Portunus trituberculatus TaxID=210409 RepID=A0A5B7K2E0_PORTR|nr:hypothetical protein [Portunus trituberculatus]